MHSPITRHLPLSAAFAFGLAGCAAPPLPAPGDDLPHARAPSASTAMPQQPAPAWGSSDEAVSYVVPAVEIVAYEFLLNQANRHFADDDEAYETDFDTFRDNLERGWVVDRDPFGVNQLGHPYSGAIYHNIARSTGHDYWTSLVYTFLGSLLWETAGETTRPSLNDQITTGIGGAFLGEPMFRCASWILEDPSAGTGGQIGATLLSPPLAVNRALFDRFDGLYPSRDPAVTMHTAVGVRSNTFVADSQRTDTDERLDGGAEFAMEYGLPGKSDYAYDRPFDYFSLEVAGATDTDNVFAHVRSRGVLVADEYRTGALAGFYGVYGIYDYLSPGIFRVASTALAFGTTAQLRLARTVALQGTVLLGAGYGAAGTVADDLEDRDYHYGAIPQAIVDGRLVFGDLMLVECAVRELVVIGVGSDREYGSENVLQLDLAVALRLAGPHAVRVEYVASHRDTHYSSLLDEEQSIGTLLVSYAYLGDSRWGVVE